MTEYVKRLRELETDVEVLTADMGLTMQLAGPRIILRSVAGLLTAARWQLEDRERTLTDVPV